MDKESFVTTLEVIRKSWLYISDTLYDAHLQLSEKNPIIELLGLPVILLARLFPNSKLAYETISWWCWDKDFGKEKDLCITIDEVVRSMDTPEELYDVLIELCSRELS